MDLLNFCTQNNLAIHICIAMAGIFLAITSILPFANSQMNFFAFFGGSIMAAFVLPVGVGTVFEILYGDSLPSESHTTLHALIFVGTLALVRFFVCKAKNESFI